jgi:hypothetical protein
LGRWYYTGRHQCTLLQVGLGCRCHRKIKMSKITNQKRDQRQPYDEETRVRQSNP